MKPPKRTVGDLKGADYNPRKITDSKLTSLAKSMKRFGDLSGIVFNRRTNRLIGAHQRMKHIRKVLESTTEIVITDAFDAPNDQGTVAIGYVVVYGERWTYREVDVDEHTEAAMNIAANAHGGEFDLPKLREVISVLDANSFPELTDIGFDEKEMEDMVVWTPPELEREETPLDEDESILEYRDDVIFNAKKDNAHSVKWGIPEIRADMLSDMVPHEVWNGYEIGTATDMLFLPQGGKIPPEAKGGVLGFYVTDAFFDKVWFEAVETVKAMVKFGWGAVIAPDFSIWGDDPLACQIYNVFRNHWCARYWQEAGVRVIPNIAWSMPVTYDFAWCGVPKNPPVISIGCRTGSDTDQEKARFLHGVGAACEDLNPGTVLLYGGDVHEHWLKHNLPMGPEYVFLTSRTKALDTYLKKRTAGQKRERAF